MDARWEMGGQIARADAGGLEPAVAYGSERPTEGQLKAAREHGLDYLSDATKDELSDLISLNTSKDQQASPKLQAIAGAGVMAGCARLEPFRLGWRVRRGRGLAGGGGGALSDAGAPLAESRARLKLGSGWLRLAQACDSSNERL
jgi:hypothetical protein